MAYKRETKKCFQKTAKRNDEIREMEQYDTIKT